jgi:lactoylglutathione lyase
MALSMFTEVASVAVLVRDAKKAAEWYRQKLGFEVTVQGHWVEAKPPRSAVVIHLCGENKDWEDDRPGGQTGISIKTDDKEKTYRDLKSKGVEFDVELTEAPWGGGKYAIFKDLDGNKFWM